MRTTLLSTRFPIPLNTKKLSSILGDTVDSFIGGRMKILGNIFLEKNNSDGRDLIPCFLMRKSLPCIILL